MECREIGDLAGGRHAAEPGRVRHEDPDVGTLEDLRAINTRLVQVSFRVAPTVDLGAVPGVEELTVDGLEATFRLRGEPTPLLRALASEAVHSMDIREPSLEELFLSFYRDQVPEGTATP